MEREFLEGAVLLMSHANPLTLRLLALLHVTKNRMVFMTKIPQSYIQDGKRQSQITLLLSD
ncbi:hypothetical protein ACTXT7_003233 [Hymenolepis weldensis]